MLLKVITVFWRIFIMIKSMTGYGRKNINIDGRDITVEIKSVNHRYFDFNGRIPRIYGFLEENTKSYVQNFISRGKVDVYILIDSSDADDIEIKLNHSLIKNYMNAFEELSSVYSLKNDMTVSSISRFGDIFSIKKIEEDKDVIWNQVKTVLDEAINEFMKMRTVEGEKLYKDLFEKADTLLSFVEALEPLEKDSIEEYKNKQFEKMSEFLNDSTIDENRILAEVAIFADRVAVDEELVRLKSHISQFKSIIKEDIPVGRKLDFLLQEMNREINTIGSKSSNIEISKIVVDFKALLEKVREQIQNIE